MTQDQSIEKSLEIIIKSFTNQINTCLPAKIVKIRDKQTIDVQPTIKKTLKRDDDIESVEYAVIPNVPVFIMCSQDYFLSFPMKVGDPVLLIFSQHCIDDYMLTDGKEIIDTKQPLNHDLNNAIAILGIMSPKNKIDEISPDDLILGKKDGSSKIIIKANNKVQIKASSVELGDIGASKPLALSEIVDSRLSALETFQNSHIHIDPISAVTGIASVPFVPGNGGASTASTKVKTDS